MLPHTLLLVDPSPKTQADVRAMLADEPISVEIAEDGQQALDEIEASRPNVVLACGKAAGVDGYAIAHFVSRQPHLQSVTVLLLLARSAVDEKRILESGAKGYLTKPLRPVVAVPRIREALARATAPPAAGDAFLITPDALAKIVQDAVATAIEAYGRERGPSPAQGDPAGGRPVPNGGLDDAPDATPRPQREGKFARLQLEMGLDDLSLYEARPSPPPGSADELQADNLHWLRLEMGIDDLSFEEASPAPPASAPDEGIEWLADQLDVPAEPEDEGSPGGEPGLAADAIRHAVETVRTRLSRLMRDKASHPAPHRPEPLAPPPREPAPESAARKAQAPRPSPKNPNDIGFTFDPLPPLPPSLLEPDKE